MPLDILYRKTLFLTFHEIGYIFIALTNKKFLVSWLLFVVLCDFCFLVGWMLKVMWTRILRLNWPKLRVPMDISVYNHMLEQANIKLVALIFFPYILSQLSKPNYIYCEKHCLYRNSSFQNYWEWCKAKVILGYS